MKKKIIILLLILIIILETIGICFLIPRKNQPYEEPTPSTVKDNLKEKNEPEPQEEKYTEDYKEYLNLPKEEQEKIEVIPRKEIVEKEELEKIKEEQKEIEIPSKFNLADKLTINVENQGQYGICWAFSSLKTLETYLQLHNEGTYNLSEIKMDYITSNLLYGTRTIHSGGSFETFKDYLMYTGVKAQDENDYREYEKEEYEKFIKEKDITIVTETIDFPAINKKDNIEEINEFRKTIKTHIMTNGGLYTTITIPDNINHYCSDDCTQNHSVTIIGWDDEYKKENFKSKTGKQPEHDGAYIAINSWGKEWGNNGLFYISYDDENVEKELSGIISTSLENAYKASKINKKIEESLKEKYKYSYIEKDNEKYISNLTINNIKSLDLSNKSITDKDLEGIDIFKELYILKLSNNQIENIEEITKLKKLESLDIDNNNIKDISALNNMEKLLYLNASENENIKGYNNLDIKELIIKNCKIEDIDISKTGIYYLDISNNNLKNIELPEIMEVLILENSNIEKINQIKNLKAADYINLANNKITTLEGIENIRINNLDLSKNNILDYSKLKENELMYLTLVDNNIEDIQTINDINVIILNLSNNKIQDISKFKNESIKSIDLSGNPNIKSYESLKNVSEIILKNNNITNIKPLEVLTNVENLDLSSNNIIDITPLNNLEKLNVLVLDENKNMKGTLNNNINYLSIENCNLEDFDISKLEKLEHINISNNKINLLEFIEKLPENILLYNDNQNLTQEELEKIIEDNDKYINKNQYIGLSKPIIKIEINELPLDISKISWIEQNYDKEKIENGTIIDNKLNIDNVEQPAIINIPYISQTNIYNSIIEIKYKEVMN